MKAFFVFMLLASVVSGFYALHNGLRVMTHNHYEYRAKLLDNSLKQYELLNENMGLTPKDLSLCTEHVANAYKVSVSDGYRLGSGYNVLSGLCLGLSALLFLTSVLGLRAIKKGDSDS